MRRYRISRIFRKFLHDGKRERIERLTRIQIEPLRKHLDGFGAQIHGDGAVAKRFIVCDVIGGKRRFAGRNRCDFAVFFADFNNARVATFVPDVIFVYTQILYRCLIGFAHIDGA